MKPTVSTKAALISIVCLFLLSIGIGDGQAVGADESVSEEDSSFFDDFDIDLHTLTDDELEQICTDLGFDLLTGEVVDDATGEVPVFTHDDYVEAARQCLTLKKEMDQVVSENPEIQQELEEERERMIAERERLEKELEEAKQQEDLGAVMEGTASVSSSRIDEATSSDDKNTEIASEEHVSTGSPTTSETEATQEELETSKTNGEKASDLEGTEGIAETSTVAPAIADTANTIRTELSRRTDNLLRALDQLVLGKLPPEVASTVRKVLGQLRTSTITALEITGRFLRALLGRAQQEVEAYRERKKLQAEEELATSTSKESQSST